MIPLSTIQDYVSQAANVPGLVISCEPDRTFPTGAAIGAVDVPGALDGYVFSTADGTVIRIAHIRQSLCDKAASVDRKHITRDQAYDAGYALAVDLHEGMHAGLDSLDEPVVECAAFRNEWSLVRLFKLPARVANWVLDGMTSHHQDMEPLYLDAAKGGC